MNTMVFFINTYHTICMFYNIIQLHMTCLILFGFVTTPWKRGCLVSVPMYEKTHPLKVHGWMGRLESHGGDFTTRYWTPLGRWSRSWLSKTCLEVPKKQGVKCWFNIVQTEISKWFYISGYWHTVWNTWSPLHFFWFQGLVMFDPYDHQVADCRPPSDDRQVVSPAISIPQELRVFWTFRMTHCNSILWTGQALLYVLWARARCCKVWCDFGKNEL